MKKQLSRRDFNVKIGSALAASTLAMSTPWACAMGNQKNKKIGVALVGLGSYSTYQLAPALQETQHCYLSAIVTGTPEKATAWAAKYKLPQSHIYDYKNFDAIKENKDVDVVYVALPNFLHAEFCVRAAKAGKHVICEKPMAMNVAECDEIIKACDDAGVKLGMGYRLQSEPYTQEVKRLVQSKTFGSVLYAHSEAAYRSTGNPDQWRLDRTLSGGGALVNMGVYAIQSSIYGVGDNPISVTAQEFSTRPDYFKDTDETITAQFEFASGATATMMTSHNVNANNLKVNCTNGWLALEPANNYGPLAGTTSIGAIHFEHESQQKLQMDDFAKHLLFDAPNKAPGAMGKRDMMIVEAIYRSIAMNGAKQSLSFAPSFGFGG